MPSTRGRRGRPARERDRRPEPGRVRREQDALLPERGGAGRAGAGPARARANVVRDGQRRHRSSRCRGWWARRSPPPTSSREEGIEAEVIDPRTLVPLDLEAIVESVRRTHRLVVAHEAVRARRLRRRDRRAGAGGGVRRPRRADRARRRAVRARSRSARRSRTPTCRAPRGRGGRTSRVRTLARRQPAVSDMTPNPARGSVTFNASSDRKESRRHADSHEGLDAPHHRDRLVAASEVVHGEPARAAVLDGAGRRGVPRAALRRGGHRDLGPGARRSGHPDERRLPPRLRSRRPVLVLVSDRASEWDLRVRHRDHRRLVVSHRHVAERDRRRLEVPRHRRQDRRRACRSSSTRSGGSRSRVPRSR